MASAKSHARASFGQSPKQRPLEFTQR
jgi:hypothetical protein